MTSRLDGRTMRGGDSAATVIHLQYALQEDHDFAVILDEYASSTLPSLSISQMKAIATAV